VQCCPVYCVGPHSSGLPWSFRVGSVGKELPGFSTLLANQNDDKEGEVRRCGDCLVRTCYRSYSRLFCQQRVTKWTVLCISWKMSLWIPVCS